MMDIEYRRERLQELSRKFQERKAKEEYLNKKQI